MKSNDLKFRSTKGAMPLVTALILSATLLIHSNNSLDLSFLQYKNATDRRISDDINGQLISEIRKVGELVKLGYFDTDKKKNSLLKISAYGETMGFNKTMKTPKIEPDGFVISQCRPNKIKNWDQIMQPGNGSPNCQQKSQRKIFIKKIGPNELILSTKGNAKDTLGIATKTKKHIEINAAASVSFFENNNPVSTCKNLKKSNAKKHTKIERITFKDTKHSTGKKKVCKDFGKKGSAKIYGINTQTEGFKIPKTYHFCGIKEIRSVTKAFHYDDGFALTFNGRILATGRFGNDRFKTDDEEDDKDDDKDDLKEWDFKKIRGKKYKKTGKEGCAIATKSCDIPETETIGPFTIDPHNKINKRFTNIIGKQKNQTNKKHYQFEFKLHVTGDDDKDKDCKHTGLELEVEYEYYKL